MVGGGGVGGVEGQGWGGVVFHKHIFYLFFFYLCLVFHVN